MKIRLPLILFGFVVSATAQTVLHSLPITLKRPTDRQHLLLAPDRDKGLFVLASDKERLKALRYNSAVFFRDSLSAERPDKEYTEMVGYSIDGNSVTAYWSTPEFEKVLGCRYDLESKTVTRTLQAFDLRKETFLSAFSENGIFYVVTMDDENPLLHFHLFRSGAPEIKTIDFSPYPLSDTRDKKIKWTELLAESGLQKMEPALPNPAALATGPVKLYASGEGFVMTVDIHRRQTALFEIDRNFRVIQKFVPFPELKGAERQNSFYHENRLYQMIVSEDAMIVSCTDLETMSLLGSHTATADKDISFRNSPLLAQTDDGDPNRITGSKRFLRRLSGSTVGLSVYRTPEDILVTIGGMRNVATTGDVLLGIAAGTSIALGGGAAGVDGLFANSSQFIFFDAVFDDNFQHKNLPPQSLAVDKLGQFTDENELSGPTSVAVFKNDVLSAYYDSSKKEITIRRFRDGGAE